MLHHRLSSLPPLVPQRTFLCSPFLAARTNAELPIFDHGRGAQALPAISTASRLCAFALGLSLRGFGPWGFLPAGTVGFFGGWLPLVMGRTPGKRIGENRNNLCWTIPNRNLQSVIFSRKPCFMKKSIYGREHDILQALLRDLRKEAGVTQVELAQRLRETQSAVSKCERGERRLDLVQLRAWCQGVGIPLAKLVAEFERRLAKKQH